MEPGTNGAAEGAPAPGLAPTVDGGALDTGDMPLILTGCRFSLVLGIIGSFSS